MNLYMNGRGLMKRTRELNYALFDAVPNAILGATMMVCGPPLSWALIIHHFPWDPPLTWIQWTSAALMSLASLIGGWVLCKPWYTARRALRAHREAMEAETAKHGSGWARD